MVARLAYDGAMAKYPHLRQLGPACRRLRPPRLPRPIATETVAQSRSQRDLYLVRFVQPEFTSLCAVTGQPDFAHLVIDYAPRAKLIESKSLKLYLGSFRNHAAFHEECTVMIGQRLAKTLAPRWLRIGGYWYPARRHADRRVLADRRAAQGTVAARSRRCTVSRTGMSRTPPLPKRPPRQATPAALRDAIRDEALRLGFDAVGFAPATLEPDARAQRLGRLRQFVEDGWQGDMGWIGRAHRSTRRIRRHCGVTRRDGRVAGIELCATRRSR